MTKAQEMALAKPGMVVEIPTSEYQIELVITMFPKIYGRQPCWSAGAKRKGVPLAKLECWEQAHLHNTIVRLIKGVGCPSAQRLERDVDGMRMLRPLHESELARLDSSWAERAANVVAPAA